MIIKAVAFGNSDEAYIENRFNDKINVIFSSKNNRGKTVLFQSMMYALGNEPIFPSSFNKDDFLFYCKINSGGMDYEILRDKNQFIVKNSDGISHYDSVSLFAKDFFCEKIYALPYYLKDNMPNLAELFLFYQLFFVPQDTRDTSIIFSSGFRTKTDFLAMLESILVPKDFIEDPAITDSLKRDYQNKQRQINQLYDKNKFISSHSNIASQVLPGVSAEEIKKIKTAIDDLNKRKSDIVKQLNREYNRKSQLTNLLSELDSLNRAIESGSVLCADCGSPNVVFKKSEKIQFDLSNDVVRSEIKKSIKKEIEEKIVRCQEYENQKHALERQLQNLIEQTPSDSTDALLYRVEIERAKETNEKIELLQKELNALSEQLTELSANNIKREEKLKIAKDELLQNIIRTFAAFDTGADSKVNDFFTKKGRNLSGSEPSVFYFSKLYNYHKYLNLPFPIIIDSFREGEIDSSKEERMITLFKELDCQVIVSATLKDQELLANKYSLRNDINAIDYGSFQENHILNPVYVTEFKSILSTFGIVTETYRS